MVGAKTMKILHTVESYPPSLGGMQEVVKQLSERLVKLGHEVTVATSANADRTDSIVNGVNIKEFNISGNMVRGMVGDVAAYQKYVLDSDYDVITNFAAQQWATDALLPIIGQLKMKKVFVPTGFSGLYWPEYKQYFESMKTWIKQYDANVFLSDDYRDINFARECKVKNDILIPNGACAEEFTTSSNIDIRNQLGIPDNHFLILHVGSHTYYKGHGEAIRIFHQAKVTNATLLIVGNTFSSGGCTKLCNLRKHVFSLLPQRLVDRKKVIITELSRADTIAAYHAADLFLFPSNIECSPIVLFECMASKTPFLTTDVGNALEIITWSNAGVALPTIKTDTGYSKADINKSAKVLEEIFKDDDKRNEMRSAGFKAWQDRFTWQKIALDYERLYYDLIAKG